MPAQIDLIPRVHRGGVPLGPDSERGQPEGEFGPVVAVDAGRRAGPRSEAPLPVTPVWGGGQIPPLPTAEELRARFEALELQHSQSANDPLVYVSTGAL